MKAVDFSTWFEDEDVARFAVLSTFEFDTVHFESRLLRSNALNRARRILVLVDAKQFQKALAEKRPARWINQRYLVVPIQRKGGVFHPKLGMILGERYGRLWCGSNNLTQSGSAHNLELLNSVQIIGDDHSLLNFDLARQALKFFKGCARHGEGHTAKIAVEWLDEAEGSLPAEVENTQSDKGSVELVHTLDQSLWDWLLQRLKHSKPRRIEVLSPFYDSDLRLLQRLRSTWPKCAVEITAQQRTSNLPAKMLKKVEKDVRLFEVEGAGSRRLHAKLLVIVADNKTICLAGSANFTSAAFDGLNIETCLAWECDDTALTDLFQDDLKRTPISAEEFESSDELPPESENEIVTRLRIKSATLNGSHLLSTAFIVSPGVKIQNLSIALQNVGEHAPAICLELKGWANGLGEVQLKPEQIGSFGAAVACFLIAETGAEKITSPISWLIQEQRLTHEQNDDQHGNSREGELRESGRGLIEQLDEIGLKEGQVQVINYLQNLNIRFDDQAGGKRGGRSSKIQIRDPFRPDTIPDWLKQDAEKCLAVETAVYEFVDRHERKVLRRHARNGNINGLPNFLDVLTAITKLLFVFYQRQILQKNQVIGRLVKYIDVFTEGFTSRDDESAGYLKGIREALSGNLGFVKKNFEEENVVGHLRTLLLIAQTLRCDPKDKGADRPSKCLHSKVDRIRECLVQCDLASATTKNVKEALLAYQILSEEEIKIWLQEIT